MIDVEGGNATLFVSPSHESLLIDTGNAGAAAVRDAGRIMDAIKDAGLTQIDHLIITHWHGDHFGGLAELAAKIPIKEFIDHGPNVQPGEAADTFLQKTYAPLIAKAKHTVAKPGDEIAMAGYGCARGRNRRGIRPYKTNFTRWGQPNPYCAAFKAWRIATAEDPQSVGSPYYVRTIPSTVHLGDLTKNKEFKEADVAPTNRLGTVDRRF